MMECMEKKQVHQVTHNLEGNLTPFLMMMECMEKKQVHQVTHNLEGNLTPFLMMIKWMKKNSNPILLHRKKKVRGPTRNLELAKLPAGKRLDINWRMNRPVGPNAKLFKSRRTILVRDVKNAPLKVKEWADIKIENKIKMFDLVLTYFKVEGRKHLVWAQMNSSYRSYRHLLKKRYFEPYDNPEIARANIPLKMEKEDWDYLVNLWIDEGWQFEQTGQEIDRLRLWELTHTRANGQACNEETQEKLDLLKELSSQVNEGTLEMNEHEVMVEVFGPERHGRVRGYGAGVTPTQLWGPRSFIFSDLQTKLQCAEKNMKTLK
nr:uncharacterized protein LOC112749474 isoform X2 [Arachis hypogaea]